MHLVILTREIGHYHDARYRAAAGIFDPVSVLSSVNDGGFAEFLARETHGYAVERLYPGRAAYAAAVAAGTLRADLEALLDRLAPDAIAISGWSNPESIIAIRWGRARGVGLVMMSETQGDDAARSPLREVVKRRIVSACHTALVGGPPHAAYIARLGIAADRVHLGYNAVDNAWFEGKAAEARSSAATLRAQHGLPDRYVLTSCRFIAKKNLPALVEAHAHFVRNSTGDFPDLVILGDGEQRALIEATALVEGMEAHVHLPGFRGYDDLPAFYALADLFAHVSTVEQWGLVINEALASGTPVLASEPCGATRTLISDGHSGIVVEPTRDSIASGLARFYALGPDARAAMAAAGREAVADFGPQRFASGMKAAAEQAVAFARPAPLAPWDEAIFARMEKTIVEQVA